MSVWHNIKNNYDSKSRMRARFMLIIMTLCSGILLTIIGAILKIDRTLGMLLITFGTTFTASATISSIMLYAGLMDLAENAKDLASIIGSKLGMPCVERFSLVESSASVGLARTYVSRTESLERSKFYSAIEEENDHISIIGSSLLGLLQERHFDYVAETLKKKARDGIEIRMMLTHPLFADFRAAQEGRNPKEIGNEIVKSLKLIKDMFEGHTDKCSVYLFHGTPTCFGIRTSKRLLLNPYPYGRQAYESPCFEFYRGTLAYDYYSHNHFQTKVSQKIDKFELTESAIEDLANSLDEYSKKVVEFEACLFRTKKTDESFKGPISIQSIDSDKDSKKSQKKNQTESVSNPNNQST